MTILQSRFFAFSAPSGNRQFSRFDRNNSNSPMKTPFCGLQTPHIRAEYPPKPLIIALYSPFYRCSKRNNCTHHLRQLFVLPSRLIDRIRRLSALPSQLLAAFLHGLFPALPASSLDLANDPKTFSTKNVPAPQSVPYLCSILYTLLLAAASDILFQNPCPPNIN